MSVRLLHDARALWAADLAIHERFDPAMRHLVYEMDPAPTPFILNLYPAFVRFWPEHPYSGDLRPSLRHGRARLLSDRVSQRAFRQTGLWNEVYIHLGAKDQLVIGGSLDDNSFWTLALNRLGRAFGPRDRDLGEFLQPRLTRLFQRHARCARAAWSAEVLSQSNSAFLVVDPDGRVLEVSSAARELIASGTAPLAVGSYVPQLRSLWKPTLPGPQIVRHSFGQYEAIGTTTNTAAPALILLGKSDQGPSSRLRMLTPREREVLDWISVGKTNNEIGALLRISPRTVSKHCERLFGKLGVENRLAAALGRAPG